MVDKQVKVCAIMQSVNDDYDGLITAMEAWAEDRLTLANVKSMLMEEYDRKSYKEASETAFVVTIGGRPEKRRRFTCYWCHTPGHIKRNCLLYKKNIEETQGTPESVVFKNNNNKKMI